MASSVIGALRVNLGLDSAQFESGARRVQSPLARMRTQFLAFAAVAAAAGAALAGLAARGAADIDKTAKSARRLGASIGGFRAMELAAGEAGVSLSTLVDGVQTMDREVARGSKNAVGALGQLGIAVADLDGLDADEKLALIADRVKELGLTSGQATALLQDLGIRNREMVLALLGGGDVFRQARKDLEDYGLAGEAVEKMAPIIELANDRIGRLGLIGKYAAQQISFLLTPALGRMAQAMTDSLREGGLLRAMIDGFVGSVGFISRAFVSFGIFMGGRYVVALVAARIATFNLAVALTTLRGALIRTGIGALVVLAGELVYWMVEASRKVGGVGVAFGLMWGVASEVIERIGMGFQWVVTVVELAAAKIEEAFERAFGKIIGGYTEMTWAIADGMNALFGTSISGASGIPTQESQVRIMEAAAKGAALSEKAAGLREGISAPLKSLQALRDAMSGTEEETRDASDSLDDFNETLEETGGGDGGGKAGAAAKGIGDVKDAAEALAERSRTGAQAISDLFVSIVDGTKKPMQALADLLKRIGEVMVQNALLEIAGTGGGGIFGWLGGLLGANANGTNNWRGGLTAVNERGGEIMNLPRGTQIIPHDISKRMADSAGASRIVVELSPDLVGRIMSETGAQAVEVVQQGIGAYDRQMPARVKAISADSRVR